MGIVKRTWDIKTNIEALREVHYSKKTYVGHPRCTWDTQNIRGTFDFDFENVKALVELHLSGKCTWDTKNVCGT